MARRIVSAVVSAFVAVLVVGVTGCSAPATGPAAPPARQSAAGGPVTMGNVPGAAPLRAGERFVQLTLPQPYTPVPPAGGTDEYRCFLMDPELTAATFLTGSQFTPQNAAIVHHAIIFRVNPGDIDQARRLDAADAGPGWTCFGATGIRSAGAGALGSGGWIGSWAPGVKETSINDTTGYRLDPGSQIIMQVHYNLLATRGRAPGPDQSGIRLRLSTSTSLTPLQTTLVAAPIELPCTPKETGPLCDRTAAVADLTHRFGAEAPMLVQGLGLLCGRAESVKPGPTQHCDQRVRQAGTVYAVAGHMHLLGRSVRVDLNPGTPTAQNLLDVPRYDFDDQGARTLAKPVTVRPGDTLRVTCTHDAALRSLLPQLSTLPPRYVVWGDGTADEMCLGIVVWSASNAS